MPVFFNYFFGGQDTERAGADKRMRRYSRGKSGQVSVVNFYVSWYYEGVN
jgi:hypothetical protein